jgi:hypothetical protein
MPQLAYILSQPRSGSTVLTAILDKRKGVVCMPEASFPQVLGQISKKERADRRWLAALYLGSTFPPTPLTIDDAEACMVGSDEEILFSLGKALAGKLGRDPAQVSQVIWKTTRTIGMHEGLLATQGKFVVLRRHAHNVFESQFRFDYGARNRKPFRYAVFAQSYEHALSKCPASRTFELEYDQIPGVLPSLFQFLGFPDLGEWQEGVSSMELVAKSCSWLTQITGDFINTDVEKRSRLEPAMVRAVDRALSFTRPFRPFMGPLRRHFDNRSMGHIRQFARERIESAKAPV